MSLKRLAKESLIYGLSGYISKSISLLLLPLYTAVLTTEDYGVLDLLGTIVVVSTFLILSGTDTSVGYYYFRKEHFEERSQIIVSSLYIRLVFSIVAFILIFTGSQFISNLIFGKDLSLFVIITGMTIVFQALHSFLFNLLRLEFRIWLYTILSSINILLSILLTIYFVLLKGEGVYGALLAQGISYGLIFIFTIFYVFKRYKFGFSYKWSKKILSYGFPLIGTGIAVWILNSSDRYFLAHYLDLSAVGIYAVGAKLAAIVGIVGGALQMSWGPFAMDIQYEKNAKDIYSKVFQLFFIANILLILGISMFAIDILKVFTQPDFYSAKAVVPFLCTSVFFSSAYFIVSIGINLTKKLQHTIWITMLAAGINVGLNFILTPAFGSVGAAFSIMAANFLIFILTYIVSQKYYHVDYKHKNILVLMIPAIVILWVSYYFNLTFIPRIIITSVFMVSSLYYVYYMYKDSYEFNLLKVKMRSLISRNKEKEIEERIMQDKTLEEDRTKSSEP